jgi:hypothetical protein
VILTIGVGLIYSGHEIGEAVATAGSLAALADMVLFGWLVIRRERAATIGSALPAE